MAVVQYIYGLFNLYFSLLARKHVFSVLDIWTVLENKIQSLACINGSLKSSGLLQAQRKTLFCGNLNTLKKIKLSLKGL